MSKNQEAIELKPCPFCGKKAFVKSSHSKVWWIECCQCQGSSHWYIDEESVIKAWNKRALFKSARSEPTGEVGDIRKILDEITKVLVHTQYQFWVHSTDPCPTATEIKALTKRARDYYLGIIDSEKPALEQMSSPEQVRFHNLINFQVAHIYNILKDLILDLASSKQEADVMWEGLNNQVAELQAENEKLVAIKLIAYKACGLRRNETEVECRNLCEEYDQALRSRGERIKTDEGVHDI